MPHLLSEAPGLAAFVRAVEAGSFSAAARDLGTTPSAVSKSVARLERHLGAKLFRRSTRVLALTPEGQAFFDRMAPLLQEIEQSADVVQPSADLRGRLRVSLPSEIARLLMDAILTRFLAQHPSLDLEIGITDRPVDLIREDYDVVFRVGHVPASDLMVRTLAQLEMVLVASPAFLDRWGRPAASTISGCCPSRDTSSGAGRPRSASPTEPPLRRAAGSVSIPASACVRRPGWEWVSPM